MEKATIRPCTVAEIEQAPNLDALLAEYAAESAIKELGKVVAQMAAYQQMEAAGILRAVGVFQGDEMVGFATVLASVLPHFGKTVGTTESIFVASHARKGGTGLKLLRAAEQVAREMGAAGFFVSAPTGSRLERVMPSVGYRDTNHVFFKELA